MTTEKLNEIMAQLAIGQKEMHEAIKKLSEETAELQAVQKEAERSRISLERTVDHVTKNVDRVTKNVERVTKNVGGLNNSMGEVVEMIVIPGLKEKMSAFGHTFTMASPGKTYSNADGSQLTEVDLLLENCDEVMIVEVKTQFSLKWMNKYLKKLELLRKNERITGMSGKTMYAAIAGIGFEAEGRALAVENGMYIIEIEEEQERVKVIPPAGKAGTW